MQNENKPAPPSPDSSEPLSSPIGLRGASEMPARKNVEPRRKAVAGHKLTNAEIIAKATKIISKREAEAAVAIEVELHWIREAASASARMRARFSEKHQRAVKQFAAALRKAERFLPEDLKFNGHIGLLRRHFEAYAQMSLKPKADAFEKRLAAEAALSLCKQFAVKPVTTNGGTFCQLAAVLYGDESANLQHYCREVLRPEYTVQPAWTRT